MKKRNALVRQLDEFIQKHPGFKNRQQALEALAKHLRIESHNTPTYWVGVNKIPLYHEEKLIQFLTKGGEKNEASR